jgi:mannose-1-phosphate guanylyltransferase
MSCLHRDRRWVIVLAGGSGTRLSSLTRNDHGTVVPKQYCSLSGDRSLLGAAMARAASLATAERTVVVVAREHAAWWSREFSGESRVRIVVQPHNRGTAPGVLLPLLAILDRDPDAVVILLPSDHFVADELSLARSLRAAHQAASDDTRRIVLLGIEPDAVEPDYGWILPARGESWPRTAAAGTFPVERFIEKPDQATATALSTQGAVWNGFFVAARGAMLRALYGQRLPALLAAFEATAPHRSMRSAAALYDRIGSSDFSRDVLEGSVQNLGVRIAPTCGWTDLGTPDRVRRCIAMNPWVVAASRPGHRAPWRLTTALP